MNMKKDENCDCKTMQGMLNSGRGGTSGQADGVVNLGKENRRKDDVWIYIFGSNEILGGGKKSLGFSL